MQSWFDDPNCHGERSHSPNDSQGHTEEAFAFKLVREEE